MILDDNIKITWNKGNRGYYENKYPFTKYGEIGKITYLNIMQIQ
jgi:hypothetical protein